MTGEEFQEMASNGKLEPIFENIEVKLEASKGVTIQGIIRLLASKGYSVIHQATVKDYETFKISGRSYPKSHSSHQPT